MTTEITIGDHRATVQLYTGIKSDKHDIILGNPWHHDHNTKIDWRTNTLITEDNHEITHDENIAMQAKPGIQFITRRQFNRMQRDMELELYATVLDEPTNGARFGYEGIQTVVDEFKDVFPDDLPEGLLIARQVNRTMIPTDPNAKIPAQKLYRLTSHELAELKKQMNELIKKRWIKPSKSPYGAPVLFVSKKDGSLRMVVDYPALNAITTKDHYPLPRTDELLDQLNGAKIFSKLDLRSGYHQIRVAPEVTRKAVLMTRYGL